MKIGIDLKLNPDSPLQATLKQVIGTLLPVDFCNVSEADIDKLFIAGAFGNYIDVANARFIGMYPEIDLSKIEIVGNAAGTGARMALLSKEIRKTAEHIIEHQTNYTELATKKNFQNIYLNSLYIPYSDLSKYPAASKQLKTLGKYPKKPPHIF